ncbi:MAG: hypothetical protein N2482_00545 [Patescibacteria group bacterium]|nr:hypothetical protein [Patescibacteria group bacterium]
MPSKPYFFLILLFLILFFILGVRYGQRVEKINKTIDYIISLTPKITPTNTPTPTPIKIEEYKSKRWGLKFKYPSNLIIKESTNTAEIIFEEKESSPSFK